MTVREPKKRSNLRLKPVEPRTGEAEIRHLVALELHVDVPELSHERRMVGKRLIC